MFTNRAINTGPNALTFVQTKPTPGKEIREESKVGGTRQLNWGKSNAQFLLAKITSALYLPKTSLTSLRKGDRVQK